MSELDQLYDRIFQTVADARGALREGEVYPLDALDKDVERLCETVAVLPEEEAAAYAEKLRALYAEFDALGHSMKTEHAALAQELKGVELHRKANAAYGGSTARAPAIAPNEPEEKP